MKDKCAYCPETIDPNDHYILEDGTIVCSLCGPDLNEEYEDDWEEEKCF